MQKFLSLKGVLTKFRLFFCNASCYQLKCNVSWSNIFCKCFSSGAQVVLINSFNLMKGMLIIIIIIIIIIMIQSTPTHSPTPTQTQTHIKQQVTIVIKFLLFLFYSFPTYFSSFFFFFKSFT